MKIVEFVFFLFDKDKDIESNLVTWAEFVEIGIRIRNFCDALFETFLNKN